MARKKKNAELFCPEVCPHLETPALRDVDSLPYFCEKFSCFLGFNRGVLRCDACLGCARGIKETGLGLIGSIRHPNISPAYTKKAFSGMKAADQSRYVSLLSEHGPALGLPKSSVKRGTTAQWAKTLTQMLDVQEDVIKNAPSPQAAVASFLGVTPGALPDLMTRQVCQLLQNLLGILDHTEHYWMNEVLGHKDSMTKFVTRLKEMPKGHSFIANVRRELEEAFLKEIDRQKMAERRRALEQNRTEPQRRKDLQDRQYIQLQNEQLQREQQQREQQLEMQKERERQAVRQRRRQRTHER